MHQVVQQPAVAKHAAAQAFICNHRSLVHDVQGVLLQVGRRRKPFFSKCILPVYLSVYGSCACLGISAHYLGGSSGWCQQDHALLQHLHRAYQSTHQRGLSRAGISLQQEYAVIVSVKQETAPQIYHIFLFFGGYMLEVAPNQCP